MAGQRAQIEAVALRSCYIGAVTKEPGVGFARSRPRPNRVTDDTLFVPGGPKILMDVSYQQGLGLSVGNNGVVTGD